MPNTRSIITQSQRTGPDYVGLVKFLLEPLLESPDHLSVDCEKIRNREKVWIRIAFEGTDKGRVFGRGGRNIQAIRSVLETAALAVSQSLYLDIYGDIDLSLSHSYDSEERSSESSYKSSLRHTRKRSSHRHSATGKDAIKFRPREI